jgi:hypothetical protein
VRQVELPLLEVLKATHRADWRAGLCQVWVVAKLQ